MLSSSVGFGKILKDELVCCCCCWSELKELDDEESSFELFELKKLLMSLELIKVLLSLLALIFLEKSVNCRQPFRTKEENFFLFISLNLINILKMI